MAIRAKADITISRIIDIQSVTRYYLLQSSTAASPNKPSTNPPTSSWTITEPAYTSGSTNTLYFVDCTEFTNDTFSYSEVSKSSSYEAAKVAYNKAVNVESRINTAETQIEQNTTNITLRATKTEVNALIEGNLIVNGFGLNRDNYNFDQWTFDGTDKCDGYPSFTYTGVPRELRIPYYMIPIDISKTYEFKMKFKGDSSKRLYLGRDEFDIDGNYISPTYCMGFSTSTTTLAQDLKNGDTVVYLTSASGWTSTTATHQLGLIFWNYKDSTGYQYPAGVYSRNAWTNLYTFSNVDKTNNTITLTSAWNHGTFPAGTQVSQSSSSGHKYFNYTNAYYPSDWTETSFTIGGIQSLYKQEAAKFNQAAKYVRFLILHNYNGGSTSSTTTISKISLCDATLKQNLSDNYYNKTQTDAMIKVESDKITSAVTRISKNEQSITTIDSNLTKAQTAANNAQTAADNAQSDIDGLEVGGRNLLLGTSNSPKDASVSQYYGVLGSRPISELGLVAGDSVTMSVWYRVPETNTKSVGLRFQTYNSSSDRGGGTSSEYVQPGETKRLTYTYVMTDALLARDTFQVLAQSGNTSVNLTETVEYWGLKLEKGNRPTDWTPAPEDMATAKDASRAQEAADAAQETAVEAESLIKQLADNISMLVTDGNGTSLMTQTNDGWTFSTAELQKTVNTTSEGLETLTNSLGDTNSVVGVLQQAVDDLGVLTDYITIGTYEDQPCIELGETDSDFKLRITNTQVVYTEGSTILAYFTNQSMHIKKAVIEEELQQGGFVWKVRSNGNMGLVWKGATS